MPDSDFAEVAGTLFEGLLQLLLIGGTVLGILVVAAVAGTWLVVRKVRRSGRMRRQLQRGSSRMRVMSADPATRELARLRAQLERSTDATRRSVQAALAQGVPGGELAATAEDLTRAEEVLCERISLAEKEPNRALRSELARSIGAQVNTLSELSADLRRTLLEVHSVSSNAQVTRASSRLSLEIGALQTWSATYGSSTKRA